MHGIKCHTPLKWSQHEDRLILGLEALHEMEQMIHKLRQIIITTQGINKSYVYKKITHKQLNIGDHICLRLKPTKVP